MNINYEYYCDFSTDCRLKKSLGESSLMTVFSQIEPRGSCEFYTTLLNTSYIDWYVKNKQNINRHIIFFQVLDPEGSDETRLEPFMDKIFYKCVLEKDPFAAYGDFAIVECEGFQWFPAGRLAEEAAKYYEPSLTWSFEDGTQVFSSDPVVFDERIVITITWPTENGPESFHGAWYVTSPSFLKERLKTIDPYYRRHMLIMEQFDKDHLVNQLQERLFNKLYWMPSHVRNLFLKRNMEYVGQLMFYER